jgi:hypothetical protein
MMDQKTWDSMNETQRAQHRILNGLTKQLNGLEGWRVEVVTMAGDTRRFIVGKSTGWQPCHLEIKTARSRGGIPAAREYRSVCRIAKVR